MTRYIVVCKDDDGCYTMAAHRFFHSRDDAELYSVTVAPVRAALIVSVEREIRDEAVDNKGDVS